LTRRPRRLAAADAFLERTQSVHRPLDETFAFFADPQNLAAITPPWLRFHIVDAPAELGRGALLRYRLSLSGVPVGWRTEIAEWLPPRTFVDVQLAGPYRLWVHTHRFTPTPAGTEIYDNVRYRVPGGPLAAAVDRLLVAPRLDAIFDYRAARLAELLA
jgi:ligand-binding SRPBCC domain-containing protein